jgi:hypothetical protein
MGSAQVGLWVVRKWVLPRLRLGYEDAYYAAAVVHSAMLLYGLVGAPTAVGVWRKYSQASDMASPMHDATRDVLRGYTEQIIERAWPEQRGRVPTATCGTPQSMRVLELFDSGNSGHSIEGRRRRYGSGNRNCRDSEHQDRSANGSSKKHDPCFTRLGLTHDLLLSCWPSRALSHLQRFQTRPAGGKNI